MTLPLEFRFALTRNEFVRSARAFYFRQPSTWLLLLVFVIFGLVVWLALDIPLLAVILPVLVMVGCYFGFLFVVVPWMIGRQAQRNARLRVEMTWRVGGDRIDVRTPHAESSMDWGTFQRVVETPQAYLLVFSINKHMFQIVPKRALTPEQAPVFEQLLAQKLGSP